MAKTKIIVAGIGGVGGYFGGVLARHFQGSSQVEINFIARGPHLTAIREQGLKVIKGEDVFIARPSLVTDHPAEAGIADFLVICTKSYDLKEVIQQLKPCIDQNTIILPLLNGVDNQARIKKMLPGHIIADGCVYIVSRLKDAGVVENSGNMQALYFGADNAANERLQRLEAICKQAGIDVTLSNHIKQVIWEKYIFVSPLATATSYFNTNIGTLHADPEKSEMLRALVEEVVQVGRALSIPLPEHIAATTIRKMKTLPFGTTSSMHADFQQHKPYNELETLTGFVVAEGQGRHIATPAYSMMYEALKAR